MMFFLWGVLRGKRNSCSKVLGSPKKLASSRDLSVASMSSTENISSLLSVEKDLPTCNKAQKVVSDDNSLINLQCLPATKTKNGDSDSKAASDFRQNDCANSTKEHGSGLNCKSVPTNQMKPPQAWQDAKSGTTLLVISFFSV